MGTLELGSRYYMEDPETFDGLEVVLVEYAVWPSHAHLVREVGSGKEHRVEVLYSTPIGTLSWRLSEAIRWHDLTYSYSDDARTWERGRTQLAKIERLAKKNPKLANQLWKDKVDATLIPEAREQFYRTFTKG